MKRFLILAVILLTSVAAMVEQKTLNIVTVNSPDMIPLKKLSTKFDRSKLGGSTTTPADRIALLRTCLRVRCESHAERRKTTTKMEPLPAGNQNPTLSKDRSKIIGAATLHVVRQLGYWRQIAD